jgi:hypothetical protein
MTESIVHGNTQHGLSNTRAYSSWSKMFDRCMYTHKYVRASRKMTRHWKKFENFYEDMGERPVGHKIHRINPDFGYFPGNCKWVPVKPSES